MKKIINAFFYTLLSTCLMASVQADVLVTYYHNDLLGSPVAATDENGNLLWQEEYMPFGERVEKDPKSKNNRQWHTGKPLDDATGLTYLGARYCDSKIGRFMAMDPVGVDPVNMHSFNRYALVNNNPYKYVDPDGEFSQLILCVTPLSCLGVLTLSALTFITAKNALDNTAEIIGNNSGSISSGTFPGVLNESADDGDGDSNSEKDSDTSSNKGDLGKLTKGDIKKLKDNDIDPEELKGGKRTGKLDLFKDKKGNVIIKPKDGSGPGEETGINLKDL